MKSSFYVSVPLTLAFVASASLAPYEPPTYPFNPYPTIVFITGAFHVDSAMDILSGQLQQAGYNTRIRSLISVNAPGINVQNDTDALRQDFLQPLIEQQGLDIVLCLHSYAGFPGSAAIAGFSKQERASKGLLGGIIGLIYQSAFIPREGDTVAKDIGGFMSLWQVVNLKTGLLSVRRPKYTFYADVPEPLASEAVRQVYGQSLASFNSSVGLVYYGDAAYDGRRVYVRCSLDHAISPPFQDMFVNHSGTSWDVMRINSSHSPFLSQPVTYAGMILGLLKQWAPASVPH